MKVNYNLNIVGDKTNKKILLIHGVGFSYANCFKSIIDKLSKTYCIISPELPGHGNNTLGRLSSVEDVAEDLEKSLMLEDIVNIECAYGISLGASIVLQISLNKKINVNNLIIDGGQYESMGEMIEPFSKVMAEQFDNLKNGIHLIEDVRKGMGYGDNDVITLKHMMYPFITRDTLYQAFKMAYKYDIKNKVEKLTMPVCIMFGKKETYASKYVDLIRSKSISDVRVVSFDNVGHAEVLGLNPELIINEIEKVL